jgi:hypothetical protein
MGATARALSRSHGSGMASMKVPRSTASRAGPMPTMAGMK